MEWTCVQYIELGTLNSRSTIFHEELLVQYDADCALGWNIIDRNVRIHQRRSMGRKWAHLVILIWRSDSLSIFVISDESAYADC